MIARLLGTKTQTAKITPPAPIQSETDDFDSIEEKGIIAHRDGSIYIKGEDSPEAKSNKDPDEIFIDDNYLDTVKKSDSPRKEIAAIELKAEKGPALKSPVEDSKPQASEAPSKESPVHQATNVSSPVLETKSETMTTVKLISIVKANTAPAQNEDIHFDRKRSQLLGSSPKKPTAPIEKQEQSTQTDDTCCKPLSDCLGSCFGSISSLFRFLGNTKSKKWQNVTEPSQSVEAKNVKP